MFELIPTRSHQQKERDTLRISPEGVSPQEGGDLLSRIAVQYHRRARA